MGLNRHTKRAKHAHKQFDHHIKLSNSEIFFSVIYPEENPPDAIESITDALAHIGIFDHQSKDSSSHKVAHIGIQSDSFNQF